MNHIKRMWIHYLALVTLIIALIFPVSWITQLIQRRFGDVESHLALALISTGIIVLGIFGGNYANKLHRFLRDEAARRTVLDDPRKKCVVLNVLGIELFRSAVLPENLQSDTEDIHDLPPFHPRKHRRKHSRFPEEKIRKVVWKWERRDLSFPARTLEEFLEEEFGSGPDGILLVAVSTFYDWRRHILKEIEEQRNHP
ncbi:MAG: hypothetical protein HZB50_03660 [Chloroflexi bacterium]|nr:hypothetical protein [Chloroflexota bacterium]